MDISLMGNPKAISVQAGAMETLSAAEGAPMREAPRHAMPNLTVTEAPAQPGASGIPPAELEKAVVRDDELGRFIDKALSGVSTAAVDAAVAEMLKG